MEWIEALGIVATLFVLASFCMNTEVEIRSLNLIGAIIFVVYGILIKSLSVSSLNAILVLVHICKLRVAFYKDEEENCEQGVSNTTEEA